MQDLIGVTGAFLPWLVLVCFSMFVLDLCMQAGRQMCLSTCRYFCCLTNSLSRLHWGQRGNSRRYSCLSNTNPSPACVFNPRTEKLKSLFFVSLFSTNSLFQFSHVQKLVRFHKISDLDRGVGQNHFHLSTCTTCWRRKLHSLVSMDFYDVWLREEDIRLRLSFGNLFFFSIYLCSTLKRYYIPVMLL